MSRPKHWVDSETIEFVSFMSGGQSFCIEINQIREIRRWTQVTALPHSEKSVLGVINLRGAVIPIVDLSRQLDLGTSDATARHVVIVISLNDKTIGLLVDSVSEILAVDVESICEAPDLSTGSSAGSSTIVGLISLGDEMSRILDLHSIIPCAKGRAA